MKTVANSRVAGRMVLGVLLILLGSFEAQPTRAADKEQKAAVGEFKLTGPYRHENLAIFMIHGADKFDGRRLLTLEEALEKRQVVIHETGNVGELAVENVSKDVEIFIQSGDILKGGKQDRLISFSMIVPAQSGKVPLAAFCVEQGRWQQRGREASALFSSSTAQLPSKALKVAGGGYSQLGGNGNLGGGTSGFGGGNGAGALGGLGGLGGGALGGFGGGGFQGGVWTGVSEFQTKLMKNAGVEVRAKESPSSLQLTLENTKVKEAVNKYTQHLARLLEKHSDAIGYAFAINGQINSAEVFGSAALFRKLWPKLMQANATEALAELEPGKKFDPVTVDAVNAWLLDVNGDNADRDVIFVRKSITKRIAVSMQETDQSIFLETRDREHKTAWVHRSYIRK